MTLREPELRRDCRFRTRLKSDGRVVIEAKALEVSLIYILLLGDAQGVYSKEELKTFWDPSKRKV